MQRLPDASEPKRPTRARAGKLLFALVSVFAASVATVAEAADLRLPPVGATYEPRRLSCHVGVFGEVVVSHPELRNVPVAGGYEEIFAQGGRAGGLIGCDLHFATRTFLGVEATAAYGSLKGSWSTFQVKMPVEATARVRLGYMLDSGVAAYVAGGPAVLNLRTEDALGNVDDSYIWGGHIATGFEFYLTPNWRTRGEYAYSYYGADSVIMSGYPFARLNPTAHTIRLGIIASF